MQFLHLPILIPGIIMTLGIFLLKGLFTPRYKPKYYYPNNPMVMRKYKKKYYIEPLK